MIYENIIYPKNFLIKKYIHSFWILKAESSGTPYLLPPDKYFNIILSFKSNTNVIRNGATKTPVSGSFIVGMRTSRVFLLPDGDVDYIGIEFYPQGLRSFLNFNCINITDSFLEISLLKNKLNEALKPVMNEVFSDEKRIEIIEQRLLYLISKINYDPNNYLLGALKVIEENNGLIQMQELCNNVGITIRQLNREFERFIGVSPKFYSRIVRFNNFLKNLKFIKKFESFADFAYQCGYYDQAHMIHECSDFTGLPPKKLITNF